MMPPGSTGDDDPIAVLVIGTRGRMYRIFVGKWLMFRELKRQDGKLTRDQVTWLEALKAAGQDVDTWRPSDLLSGRIATELAALAGIGGTA